MICIAHIQRTHFDPDKTAVLIWNDEKYKKYQLFFCYRTFAKTVTGRSFSKEYYRYGTLALWLID